MKEKISIRVYLKRLNQCLLKKLCIVSVIALFMPVFAFSQGIRINGTVFDNEGPLAGVAIVIKGTTQGVASNDNGEFSITISGEADTLEFVYAGSELQYYPPFIDKKTALFAKKKSNKFRAQQNFST